MTDVTVVDLFCGAGGFSTGAALALEELGHDPGEDVELHAINHWGLAVETHEINHPWAEHYLSDVDDVDPLSIADPGEVDLLVGGPECTHFSTARGGKPVDDQKREPAFNVLTWIQKLRPQNVLIENVPEFEKWGAINDETGTPAKDGEVFDVWLTALNALGYAVDHDVLTCADYGDPTSRNRLFVVARRDDKPSFPDPTHSNEDDELPDWRPAAEIIDWSDPGSSMWTRDLENPRVQPLKYKTMRRIAEGIRRHCDDRLDLFADALDWIGRVSDRDVEKHGVDRDNFCSVEELREFVVPAEYAGLVADAVDRPFLVAAPSKPRPRSPYLTKYYGTNFATDVEEPIDTITAGGNKYGLTLPDGYLLGQHTSNPPRDADRPLPTVATIPRIGLSSTATYLLGQHSNSIARDVTERPVPTLATGGKVHLAEPEAYCLRQQSGGVPADVEEPLPTVSGGGAISLSTVAEWPLIQPKNGFQRGIHSNPLYEPDAQPHHTVTKDPRSKLATPSLVRYSHGGASLGVDEPMPTIATEKGGVFALTSPFLTPLYNERAGQRPRTRTLDRPLMTVPAKKGAPAGIAMPFLTQYYGRSDAMQSADRPLLTQRGANTFGLVQPWIDDFEGPPDDIRDPLGGQESKDRFALVVPEAYPYGLDIRYRMLKPSELKQAQGFPEDYYLAGDRKEDITEQIGNAVPVNTAKALCKHLLGVDDPSLSSFDAGLTEQPDIDLPTYEEAVSDD